VSSCAASGYDQLAAIYALEHTRNNVERAIDLLAQCGVQWEDVDGRQSPTTIDATGGEGKGKEKADAEPDDEENNKKSEKEVVSAITDYLRTSVFVVDKKGKGKLGDDDEGEGEEDENKATDAAVAEESAVEGIEEKVRNNNFLAILMYYLLSRIRNCMNFCVMCDKRLVSRYPRSLAHTHASHAHARTHHMHTHARTNARTTRTAPHHAC
jgi:hypothetical protein